MRAARLFALVLTLAATRARAQGGILLQGIADAELWSTDSASNLLTRNAGKPGALGRLVLWGAVEPWRQLVFYAQGEVEGGSARSEVGRGAYFDQLGARMTLSNAFVIDVGKFPHPLGTFAGRQFSTRNPLIGVPDGYTELYPIGAKVSGVASRVDYRVAVVSLPISHPGYVPDPSAAYRPVIGAGVTPFVGFRLGASATVGPYLNKSLVAPLYAGKQWSEYWERIVAGDVQFSRGYLETRAEVARSSYDVPNQAKPVRGINYYGEAKYTFTPQFFVAARVERNEYPFIRPIGTTLWVARVTKFTDAEVGAGYRFTAATLVKLSVRADHWEVGPAQRSFAGPGGYALAFQLSRSFDVLEWIDRRR